MEFDREKYIDLIMYILFKNYDKKNLGKTVLSTLLYFIDFNYYELYGESITKETYIKSKKGIKPKHLGEITQDLISKNQLFLRKEPYYNRILHRYYPTVLPICKFSKKELETIDFVLEQFSNANAHNISQYVKSDSPLMMADFGEEIDCRYVFSRNEKYVIMKKI